jgi:hypothetical protein
MISLRKRVSTAERKEWLLFALLVGPNLFLFSVFTYWPLIEFCALGYAGPYQTVGRAG